MVDALGEGGDEGRGQAAKSCGEVLATCDPQISEWGNPTRIKFVLSHCQKQCEAIPGEVKHLSTRRKREKFFIP